MEVTFDESFAGMLKYEAKLPTIGLQLDAQFGNLHRFSGAKDSFWQLKASHNTDGQTADELRASVMKQIEQLKSAIVAGEPLRVWWSETADDQLGFYWFCQLTQRVTNQVTQVLVPLMLPKAKKWSALYRVSHLGELDFADIQSVLQNEHSLSVNERQSYANGWQAVLEENAPLRVSLNGTVVGVSEAFFDHFLSVEKLTNWPATRVIGEAMGNYSVDVPDWWYRYRLDRLSSKGD